MYAKGGWGAGNEAKALKPVFEHLRRLGFIKKNPIAGIELDRPKIEGFPVADADDIAAFQNCSAIGTRERLMFDLALYTGAARVDLAKLGRANIDRDPLVYVRQKSGVIARVPSTLELQAVIDRTPDISPAFILGARGKPYTPESLGNLFREAAVGCAMTAPLPKQAFPTSMND